MVRRQPEVDFYCIKTLLAELFNVLSPPRLMLMKDMVMHSCGDRPKEACSTLNDETDKRVVVMPRRYADDLS